MEDIRIKVRKNEGRLVIFELPNNIDMGLDLNQLKQGVIQVSWDMPKEFIKAIKEVRNDNQNKL